jgi:uncharacterized membrane protein
VKRTIIVTILLTWLVVSFVPAIQATSLLGRRGKK